VQIVAMVSSLLMVFSSAVAVMPVRAASEVPSQLTQLSAIVGKKIENSQGKNLGNIEEVVIDAATGDVAYAVLAFGGFLGLGEKLFALPWSALKQSTSDTFTVPLTEEQIKKAPGFDRADWPSMEEKHWGDMIHAYYGQPPYWTKRLPAEEARDESQQVTPRLVHSSHILRSEVMNPEGQSLGNIEDVVLNARTGKVVYAVLSFGEFLNLGGKWFAIPWRALKSSSGFGTFTLEVQKEKLVDAPGFDGCDRAIPRILTTQKIMV
jgi:sporulation protein YlmC with PRC-barrel domain